MGIAYFIVAEPDVHGIDCDVNGKPLAHVRDRSIQKICREAGVTPLEEFFSQNPDEAAWFCEAEGIDPPEGGFPPVEWFSAADGLRTIRTLLERVSELTTDRGWNIEDVATDLQQFEEVLVGLVKAGVRFHLSVDI